MPLSSSFPPDSEIDPDAAGRRRRWLPPLRGRHLLWYGAALALALVAGLALYVALMVPLAPGVEDLRQVRVMRPSVLLSADGQTLATFRRRQQEPVKLEQVSPRVVQALIATEDRRFYEHHGIDLRRTVGALFHTLRGDTQGGSTITQQLARNLFPEDIGRSRNLHRKLKEMLTALRIEQVYNKRQILERYLNSAPFLYNAVGIEMAARTYFDKPARALDAAEAATLVGMLKGTHYYNPVLFPERALKRRNLVLQQMALTGALAPAEAERLKQQPLNLAFNRQDDELGEAPHFAAYARRWLLDWADAHDVDLYADGLVIETTLDSRLQRAATEAVQRQAALLQQVADVEWGSAKPPGGRSIDTFVRLHPKVQPFRHFWSERPQLLSTFVRETPQYRKAREGGASDAAALQQLKADDGFMAQLRAAKTRLEAGFVAMDPHTGAIKAWVGSRDFAQGQFDHVAQAERQPGSTFKPIVYGAALEAGIGPERTYLDEPVEVRLDARTVWRPTDMHGFSGEPMTLRDGLVYSKNTITAQVSQEVGVPRIVGLAQAMGVDQSKLDPVPSIALGTSPVTLLEMVDAYGTIAAEGVHHPPLFVRRILAPDGRVLGEFGPRSTRALSPDTAVDLIDMMRGVVNQGTGTAVKTRFGIVADIAGKTGTTQYNTDGWFILMHPDLVAGAWVGFDDQRVTMRSDHWGQGGHNAILLVGDFFRDALKARLLDTKAEFPPPRRPPIVTTYAPGEVEDSYGAIEDVLPAYPYPASPPGVERASSGGVVVIGDTAGVQAMRRSEGPPKSAEELEQAFGGGTVVATPRPASGAAASVPGMGTVSTSGTEGAASASAVPMTPAAPAPAPPPPPAAGPAPVTQPSPPPAAAPAPSTDGAAPNPAAAVPQTADVATPSPPD